MCVCPNSEHALCTNGEVSVLGPCVNSPHNTTTRLGTMWAARLLIADKSALVEYGQLLSNTLDVQILGKSPKASTHQTY